MVRLTGNAELGCPQQNVSELNKKGNDCRSTDIVMERSSAIYFFNVIFLANILSQYLSFTLLGTAISLLFTIKVSVALKLNHVCITLLL